MTSAPQLQRMDVEFTGGHRGSTSPGRRWLEQLEQLAHDVRHALRGLRRAPAFAITAILTLALGVGANTAIFSVVHAMLLSPLPYRDPAQLIFVWEDLSAGGYPRAPLSGPEVKDLRDRTTLLADVGAIWATSAALTGDADPQQLRIGLVTTNFFQLLGVGAAHGRVFAPEDESQAAPRAILLGWPLWQRRFGGDSGVIGRKVQVNDNPVTVVGVMPESFRLLMPPDANVPDDLEAWQLFNPNVLTRAPRGQKYLRVVARMKEGVTLEQARGDIDRVAATISREFAEYGAAGRKFTTVALHDDDVRQIRPMLLALFGGAAILLIIACVNVASLLVARAASRTHESAVRLAMGAGLGRLTSHALTEGLVLAAIGGATGLVIGNWTLRALLALRPDSLSRLGAARIDGTVLAFTLLTATVWGLLCSLAPLAEVRRTDLTAALKQEGRRTGGGIHYRVRSTLVVLQVALSMILLVGAGLMVRTFLAVQQVDPGFRTEGILTFKVSPPGSRYRTFEQANAFARRLQDELAALPGVTGVGSVSHMPYDNVPNWGGPYTVVEGADDSSAPFADNRSVSPGYFETVGVRLVEGRCFTEADDQRVAPVVIVDAQLAKRAWPGQSAIGKPIWSDPFSTGHTGFAGTVVGVVQHLRHRSMIEDLGDQIYFPVRQVLRSPLAFAIRTTGDPAALASGVTRTVAKVDPELPVYDVRPLAAYAAGARAAQRFAGVLAAVFAAVALLLASVGVYGVIAYAAGRRRYEFGVRLALGALPGQVLTLVLREGLVLTALGLGIGIVGAALGAQALRGQLYGVSVADVVSYATAILTIGLVALAACWVPARRASAVSPSIAMRTD